MLFLNSVKAFKSVCAEDFSGLQNQLSSKGYEGQIFRNMEYLLLSQF